MKQKIYLDNNASTKVDDRVIERMTDFMHTCYGNPSSIHSFGQETKRHLTKARDSIANYLGCHPEEVIFTAGGTEGMNMAIRGLFGNIPKGHLITSDVEHSCVTKTAKQMEERGATSTMLSPRLKGAVSKEMVQEALCKETKLVTLMAVNNETGVKTDYSAIASLCHQRGIPFLVDGVALLGKEQFTIPTGVSAMAFSGHKCHAPQGIGILFIRRGLKLQPLTTGGLHEYGHRAGTENMVGIVGIALAIELLDQELPVASERMKRLRDRFEEKILASCDAVVHGNGDRVVNTSNICFHGVNGETLLTMLDIEGVLASHGSACTSGALEPSRVLLNMGIPIEEARSSLRFSISRFTTEEEIDRAVEIIVKVVAGH